MNNDLVTTDILKGFTAEQLVELRSLLAPCQYLANEVIIRQNQHADDIFVVISGEVEICHHPYDGPPLVVDRLSSGGVFGWSAILGRSKYTSSVTALTKSYLYRISAQKLQRFCETHHETGVVLLEKMALSVAQQPDRIHEKIMKILQSAMDYRNE